MLSRAGQSWVAAWARLKASIALTEGLANTVRLAVASGDFGSSSEVVRTALREWGQRRERAQAEIELIRELWKEGIDSGPSELETIDDIIADARRRHVAPTG